MWRRNAGHETEDRVEAFMLFVALRLGQGIFYFTLFYIRFNRNCFNDFAMNI